MPTTMNKETLDAYERYSAESDVTRILRASIIESGSITELELDEYTLHVERREAAYLAYQACLDAVSPIQAIFNVLNKKLKRK